jgi:nitroimidazol reductase NimA-like FMN-containing flavoprotein (pyridoxamine 5'-phosphate oxidase superfamily)
MSPAALDAFLARPLIARLATSRRGQPRIVPMWFLWDGSSVWMETSPTFVNVRILRDNPLAAIAIDEAVGPLRFRAALMQGEVEIVAGPPEMVLDMARRIYARYLKADELASAGEAMLRGSQHVLLHFSPRVIKTWDTTAS